MKSILNILITGGNLIFRFLVNLWLLNILDVENYGLYILTNATVSMSIYVSGFDVYTFTNREFINNPSARKIVISNHSLFILLSSFVTAFMVYFFVPELNDIAIGLMFLMLMEIFAQELARLLICEGYQINANIVNLIRSVGWFPIFYMSSRDIESYIISWGVVTGLTCIYAVYKLKLQRYLDIKKINFSWTFTAIKTSFVMYTSTLMLRSVYFLDKKYLSYIGSLQDVGIYGFLLGIAMIFTSVLEAGIFSFSVPQMIRYNGKGKKSSYSALIYDNLKKTILLCILFILCMPIIPEILAWLVDKREIINNKTVFYLIGLAMVMNGLSLNYHYILFSKRVDSFIRKSTVYSYMSSIVVLLVCTQIYPPLLAMSLTLICFYTVMLVSKMLYVRKIT